MRKKERIKYKNKKKKKKCENGWVVQEFLFFNASLFEYY